MKYRENDYFNNIDDYLIHDSTLKLNFVSKLYFCNGNWYSNKSLNYKMTSIICININELL
jgi:hypothetical protein